ncbi:2-aminoethylphosphonate:pyruvate aminotransferase [Bordetella sp. H567]|uniref:2-aminoethylphosphonate--pyruvate transaminase n=1 Tax=Bordetella sp. H567 TaxID=1697043 RepID=UPI00081C9E49|nr:2-aminoethylphosphonate--pyruvate transaminase [Bordetella sp. H567]AOB30310.1 2-aminoethylphosphonate:pyruvate aminotransferase [Bordetella sp. H567]
MLLLIPGPVTTADVVKAALAQDYAPWDNDFRAIVRKLCADIREAAGGAPDTHVALPLSGSGHFALEAAVRTFVPRTGKILIPATGAYAARLQRLASEAGRAVATIPVGVRERVQPARLAEALCDDPRITHVGLVYSETGSGICHDVPMLAQVAGDLGRRVIVDAVSAFGALPLDVSALPSVDAVILTSNKCLEGPPGAAFAVCRVDRLEAAHGNAGSWSLNLADIHEHDKKNNGGARFTPPAPTLAALSVAMDLYRQEGRAARLARYTANQQTLYEGIRALGLTPYLPPELQGPIIVNVLWPTVPGWSLQGFVDALKQRGFVISNFYNTEQPTFRVGCIGAITPADMSRAVDAMGQALSELPVAA